MDNKITENLIETALNSQKPDKKVLSAAKEVMDKNKQGRAKNKLWFYALASCSVILTVIGIIFIIPVSNNNGTTVLNAFSVSAESYGLIIGIALIIAGILSGVIAIMLRLKNGKKF